MESDPDDAPKSYAEAREFVVDYSVQLWAGRIPTQRYLSLEVRHASETLASILGTAVRASSQTTGYAASASNKVPGLAVGEQFW